MDVGMSLLMITSNNALIERLLAIVVTLASVGLKFLPPKEGVLPLGNNSWFSEPDSRSSCC